MKVYYLSGAARVSTDDHSASSGARAHITGVIKGFEQNGWSVEKYIYGDIIKSRFKVTDIYKSKKRTFLKRVLADVVRIVLCFYHIFKLSNKTKGIDLVYERLGAFQLLGWPFKKRGITWVLETNSIISDEAVSDRKSVEMQKLCRYFERKAYEHADWIVCTTEELKNLVIKNFGIDKSKLMVIPDAVDSVRFNPDIGKQKKEPQNVKPVIGFVGNLVPWAGLDILIEATDRIKSKYNFTINVIGDGICREEWEKMVKTKKVESHFNFLGKLPWSEVPQYINNFDIGYSGQVLAANGSMYFSPLKIYEYAAMGKPIIASRYPDAEKVIIEGETGYLFTSGSVDELVACIEKFIKEREMLKGKAEIIRGNIIKHHSWESRVKAMLDEIGEKNV